MRSTKAFTLVELLVVIGIIAVILSVLLPAVSALRQSATSTACLSNLRQMAAAATDYALRNGGSYPPAQWTDPADFSSVRGWDFVKRGGQVTGPGFLWAPQPVTPAQQCLAFDGGAQSAGDAYTGYNYNTSYIGRGTGESVSPARVAQVKRPSRTLLFGDGQWRLGANKYMRSPLRSPTEDSVSYGDGSPARAAGTQGFRHRGATNAAFCDGHAESLRDRTDGGNSNVAPGTGFIRDPDRPDDPNSLYDLE
jgi:prepilin-type processing-associated H-X9-DG protein/prepilin-type N-terminal cleavage/methylation domain-containing protein